jgi:hypothetical protein
MLVVRVRAIGMPDRLRKRFDLAGDPYSATAWPP